MRGRRIEAEAEAEAENGERRLLLRLLLAAVEVEMSSLQVPWWLTGWARPLARGAMVYCRWAGGSDLSTLVLLLFLLMRL